MNRLTQSIITVLLGGLLLAITVSGRFTAYVKPGFAPLLIIGGSALVAVGLISLVLAVRADLRAERSQRVGAEHGHDDGAPDHAAPDHVAPDDAAQGVGPDAHGHDHDSSRAPWLIVVPVLVLLLVAPPALGADSITRTAQSQAVAGYSLVGGGQETGSVADRQNLGGAAARAAGGDTPTGEGAASTFPPLPDGSDPPLTMRDTVLRALYDPGHSLADHPVTVTGFVAPAGDGFDGGWSIARMVISCCAADATPVQLHVDGDAPLPSDTWVEAVITAVPGTGNADNFYVPTVQVHALRTVAQPADPYEH
ncbi:TIGR03943 family putative permease subunit [Nakamurella leprariae]|uniref:TIGR03943 family protein n=1 Tax=Nakamurella leprariae TaxID=2803911 RepID=A0A939C1G6_9ACTN|nr:TIGR03943 family protein [Nakamurella leprariae]MBM9467139.1 TIGR03943 family protein [Nakamurella leprariae]